MNSVPGAVATGKPDIKPLRTFNRMHKIERIDLRIIDRPFFFAALASLREMSSAIVHTFF